MAKQPFVPVSQVIRFRYVGTHQTAPWVNGFALKYTGVKPDASRMGTLATELRQAWTTSFGNLATTATTLTQVQCWDITDAQGASGTDGTSFTGAVAPGTLLPVQSAIVVSWPVQDRWRGGHFRTYMFARNSTSITSGRIISQTERDAYNAQALTFRSNVNALSINGSAVTLCGVRYFPTGFNADGTPIVKTSGRDLPFGVGHVRQRLDSQRRRSGKEIA